MPSLPVPPTRSFGFNSFSTTNPTSQQPGDKLDINLDAGFAFDASLLTWSRTVVADTGGLKAGIVTMASLDAGLLAQITASVAPDISAQITAATAAASQAVASAALALTYRDTSNGYVTAASGFATTAQTAASNATAQAGLALVSANNAGVSATSAGNSRSDASGFATNAGNSAYVSRMWADYLPDNLPSDVLTLSGVSGTRYSARYHAAAASSSASTASTAATTASNASGSAVAALALVQAAQADVAMRSDSFRTVYLGPQASPPTTDPLGGGVGPGDLYFDTTLQTMRVKTSVGWSDIGAPDSTGFATWAAGTFVGQMTFAPGAMAPFTIGSGSQGIVVTGLRADTAVTLATARTLALSGDGTGSISFNGSANATIPLTLATSGVAAGTYALATVTVDAKGRVTAGSSNTAAAIALTNATASTSTTTGALKVAGGLGVAGAIWGATVNATGAVAGASLSITGSGNFTGNVTLSSTTPILTINKGASGQGQGISGNTNGSRRWYIEMGNNEAEAGSNAGSNWSLSRYNDGGTYIASVMSAARDTGQMTFALAPQINTAPAADNQAMRRIDVGWERITSTSIVGATSATITLPAAFSRIQIYAENFGCSVGATQDIWVQYQMNGVWLSGPSLIYETGVYGVASSGSYALYQPLTDRNGSNGSFFLRFGTDTALISGKVELWGVNNTVSGFKCAETSSLSNWGTEWVQWRGSTIIGGGAYRIEAVRLIITTSSPRALTSGTVTVLGSR